MKNILFYVLVIINIFVIILYFCDDQSDNNLMLVEIKGAVNKPGVYKLKESSSVKELIDLSGGLLEDADISVTNQAKTLENGMVVIIYTKQEIEEMRFGTTSVKYIDKECVCPRIINDSCIDNILDNNDEIIITNGKISLNSATIEELIKLPGIGENKALKIIEYRDKNNGFNTIEEILNVSGIGNSVYEKIKDYITL